MKTIFTLFSLLLVTATTCYAAVDSFQERGRGDVYYLKFIKVYEAALFTPDIPTSYDVLNPGVSKCLKLVYDVALTSENFIEGANTILRRQHSEDQLNRLVTEIETLHSGYRPVQEGDSYHLCYDAASETTTLSLNGEDLVAITSKEFSTLYFGIWLSSNNPIDKKLQRTLIGQKK